MKDSHVRYFISFLVACFIAALVILYAYPQHTTDAERNTVAQPSWIYDCAVMEHDPAVISIARAACLGYVRGLVDTHNIMSTLATGLEHPASSDIALVCVDKSVSRGTLIANITQYYMEHPNHYDDLVATYEGSNRAFALVIGALNKLYPCGEKQ